MDDLYTRLAAARTEEQAIFEAERPQATLTGGGAAPDFVVERGSARQTLAFSTPDGHFPTINYRERTFDLLGALGHDVSRVNTEDELNELYTRYFPDSLVAELPRGLQSSPLPCALDNVSIVYAPQQLDPGAAARYPVLAAALKSRATQVKAMSGWKLLKAIAGMDLELASSSTELKSGPCYQKPVPRQSGSAAQAAHNRFADRVTGSTTDYYIRTPEGMEATTDGLDATDPRLVWEVKTRHEWATEAGLAGGSIFSPLINSEFIYKLEAQRARYLAVTSRCSLKLAYAVDSESLASFLRSHWGNNPPVYFR